jgi:hypothetical protein
VGEAPGEVFGLDACQAGEQAPGEGGGAVPGDGLESGLLAGEGVAQGRADSLVDAADGLRIPEVRPGEVAVVDVAECVRWAVALPPHVNVDRLDVRPVRQGAVTLFARDE